MLFSLSETNSLYNTMSKIEQIQYGDSSVILVEATLGRVLRHSYLIKEPLKSLESPLTSDICVVAAKSDPS
jgi:hypothetical protein